MVAGVTTPPAGSMIAAICGDGTDVNDKLCNPLAVAGWLRVNPEPLLLICAITVPDVMPDPVTGSPTASSLVFDAATAVDPLVTVPVRLNTVPGTGTVVPADL